MDQQKFEEARREIDQAILLSHQDEEIGQSTAQKLLERWQKEVSGTDLHTKHIKPSVKQALSLSENGDFQQAVQMYHILTQSASEEREERARAIIKFSHLLCQLGRVEEARKLLERLKREETTGISLSGAFFNAFGTVLLATELFSEAIDAYQEAIRISPGYLNPCYGLGRTYLWLGKPYEALKAFAEAKHCETQAFHEGKPIKAPLFWLYNGEGLANLLVHNETEASKIFSKAARLAQERQEKGLREHQVLNHLGLAYLGQGIYQDAEKAYREFSGVNGVSQVKGILQEMLFDIELIGSNTQVKGWHKIYALIDHLLSGR